MNLLRRFKFYGFGFGIGLLMVYGLFGNRSCSSPNELKMQELISQQFVLSEKAICKLRFLGKSESLLKIELKHFEVNYDISSARKKPCGEYFIEQKKDNQKKYDYKIILYDCDTITKINDISIISNKTCTCQ